MAQRKIIGYMNSFGEGISGGDACFIEIFKRISDYRKVIVTSALGRRLCESRGVVAQYLVTSQETSFRRIIPTYLLRMLKALFLNIGLARGDIVYGSSDFLPDVFPCFMQKIFGKKILWVQKSFHFIPPGRPIPYIAQKISFFLVRHFADLIIVDNTLLKGALIKLGFPAERMIITYPGLDRKSFEAKKRRDLKTYDGVFLGRLHPSKGIFDLIKIWQKLISSKPDLKLAIIGKGRAEIEDQLKESISSANLQENISLLGYLSDKEVAELLAQSKFFVFPSHEEGFGIAILEAMASGLPAVAWDLPVYKEVFPQGLIRVRENDFSEFIAALSRLLEDESFYREVSIEAKEMSFRYDWETIARQELEAIKKLMAIEDGENNGNLFL